jgi:catalase
MASQILATASHVADKAKEMTGVKNAKVAQLAAVTKDVHDPSHRITSDYGVKKIPLHERRYVELRFAIERVVG